MSGENSLRALSLGLAGAAVMVLGAHAAGVRSDADVKTLQTTMEKIVTEEGAKTGRKDLRVYKDYDPKTGEVTVSYSGGVAARSFNASTSDNVAFKLVCSPDGRITSEVSRIFNVSGEGVVVTLSPGSSTATIRNVAMRGPSTTETIALSEIKPGRDDNGAALMLKRLATTGSCKAVNG